MNFIKYLLFASLFLFTVEGQSQFSGLDVLDGKEKLVVPFEYVNGFILVNIIYGRILPLKFLLDTGASHNILFKKNANDLLGIEYTDTIIIGGADIEMEMKALVSRNIPIAIKGGKVILRDMIVLEDDYLDLAKILGQRVDGILGGDFLKGLIVGINYKKQEITFYDSNKWSPKKKFTKHDIDIKNYKPYVNLGTQIEDKNDTLKFLLDTGASLALLCHSNKIENFRMPDNVIVGNLGKGIGGDLTGFIGITNYLDFGGYKMNRVISSFQEIDSSVLATRKIYRDGLVGNVILSRFHMIIDYVNESLYLHPTMKLSKEFEFDKSGLLIYAFGDNLDQYYVKTVYPNTPASEAGILPGDRILKLGCWPLGFYSLDDLIDKFQGKEGKTIKLKVLRKGEEKKVEFVLRDLFKNRDKN